MKLKPYSQPIEWRNASLADRLKALIQHYCSGPCGQSQTTGEIRSNTRSTLREAIFMLEELEALRKLIQENSGD